MLRVLAALIVPLAIFLSFQADAQDENAASSRYTMNEVEGGILRLDTESGAMSFCREVSGMWRCELTADDRLAYEREMTRLADRVDELEKEVARLQGATPGKTAAGEKQAENKKAETKKNDGEFRLPSEEDMEKLMSFFETFMRRFFETVKSITGSGQGNGT